MRIGETAYRIALLLVLCRALAVPAWAHQIDTSYTTIAVGSGQARIVLSIYEADLYLLFPQLDRNGDQVLWADELLAGADLLRSELAARVEMRGDGEILPLQPGDTRVESDANGHVFARIHFTVKFPGPLARLELDLTRLLRPPLLRTHRNLVKVSVPGRPEALAVLSADTPVHEIPLRAAEVPEEGIWTQIGRFVRLGVEHIFLGYDHLMFLLALIVVGTRLGQLVKIITAFTVAHSITLVLAALEWVSLPSRVVESGIALSIAYVAAENFWLKRADYRWILTFCFGFVHGFGFANVLVALGLPSRGLVASLLAFNVGVEIGQVVIVTGLFPLILWVARGPYHKRAVQVVSAVVLLFGLGWLIERALALSYMPI